MGAEQMTRQLKADTVRHMKGYWPSVVIRWSSILLPPTGQKCESLTFSSADEGPWDKGWFCNPGGSELGTAVGRRNPEVTLCEPQARQLQSQACPLHMCIGGRSLPPPFSVAGNEKQPKCPSEESGWVACNLPAWPRSAWRAPDLMLGGKSNHGTE